jgi:hypothetical protein
MMPATISRAALDARVAVATYKMSPSGVTINATDPRDL